MPGFRFLHWVEREVEYATLLVADRRRVHAQAAQALEESRGGGAGGADSDDALLLRVAGDTADSTRDGSSGMGSEIASHWASAGFSRRSALWRAVACQEHERRGRFEEAVSACVAGEAETGVTPSDSAVLWSLRGSALEKLSRYDEAVRAFEASIAALGGTVEEPDGGPASAVRTRILLRCRRGVGNVYRVQSRLDEAEQAFLEARRLARELGDEALVATSANGLAAVVLRRGRYREALALLDAALPLCRAGRDRRIEATCLNTAGTAHGELGEYGRALERYEAAVRLFEEAGDLWGWAHSSSNVGTVHQSRGDNDAALEQYEAALAVWRRIGARRGEGNCLANVAAVYFHRDEDEEAARCYRQAFALTEAVGDRRGMAHSRIGLASVLSDVERHAEALAEVGRFLFDGERHEHDGMLVFALVLRATSRLRLGDRDGARADADRALELAQSEESPEALVGAQGIAALLRGDESLARQKIEGARSLGNPDYECDGWLILAEILTSAGRDDEAAAAVAAAEAIGRTFGLRRILRRVNRIRATVGALDEPSVDGPDRP